VILTEGRILDAPVDHFCHFLRARVARRIILDRYVCDDLIIGRESASSSPSSIVSLASLERDGVVTDSAGVSCWPAVNERRG
jgi:hypothetical protein